MSKLLNSNNPLDSALREGIVLGVLATLREFSLTVSKSNIKRVLSNQQFWTDTEIDYFLDWVVLFNIQQD